MAVSGLSSFLARIKSSCNLIGNRFEMPNVSYTQPLVSQTQTPLKKLIDSFNFENIDFEEYNVNELLFDKMNSEMGFYNLKRYNSDKEYQTDFEEWFRRGFKWDSLKWSVFGFDISQPEFESKASEYVLEEMYYNREIIYAT